MVEAHVHSVFAIRLREACPRQLPGGRDPRTLPNVEDLARVSEFETTRRAGGKRTEFYLERAQVRFEDTNGKLKGFVLARDARPTPDKGAWAAYMAATEFCPMARFHGHKGVALSHYGFDRGALFNRSAAGFGHATNSSLKRTLRKTNVGRQC